MSSRSPFHRSPLRLGRRPAALRTRTPTVPIARMAAAPQQNGSGGWMHGVVKHVPSGDRLTIMGVASRGPAPERDVSLAHVTAPRLGSPKSDREEEPLSWECREHLRRRCIGQRIVFRVDYRVESIGRDFGTVYVGGADVALEMVRLGLLPGLLCC